MAQCFLHGNGGANPLNFKVVGNPQPTNPRENTIWVDTDVPITSWHFGADEPNVYKLSALPQDPHVLIAPHRLSSGEIINFELTQTLSVVDWVRIIDVYNGNKAYFIRNLDGTVSGGFIEGLKLSVVITDSTVPLDDVYVSYAGIVGYGSYHHEEGAVWITTGMSSTGAFNALKKNGIQVYPISAKQYINNAWVDKEAKIYQNGAWVNLYEWNGQLYELGEEFISKTGGWDIVNGRNSSYDAGQGTKEATEIHLACGTVGTAIAAVTVNKVDLSKYTTLKCNVTNYKRFGKIQVASSQATNGDGVAFAEITGEGTYSLNIANLTGSYYILISTWYANNSSPTSLHFDKVWLE